MNEFKISVIDRRPKKRQGLLSVIGQIEINDFKESLYMPLDWWSVEEYEQQWHEGLDRLKNHNTSCLVATIQNPHKRRFINWWQLYKIDDKIYIQNSLLIAEIYDDCIGEKSFTVENCYEFIEPRVISAETSEWVVDYP